MKELFNNIYLEQGFDGVVEFLEEKLEYGSITHKEKDIICISTCGWSDDEDLLHNLNNWTSLFYYKHYIGSIRGGHYYYSKSGDITDIEIQYDAVDNNIINPFQSGEMAMDNWYHETIMTKLDEIVAVMNTEECMEEIHNNNQLGELYFALNSAMDTFQKVQRINKQQKDGG